MVPDFKNKEPILSGQVRHQILQMFHRKVHPESSASTKKTQKKQQKESKKKTNQESKKKNRDQELHNKPPQFKLAGSESNGNRECWIKTDADCKYAFSLIFNTRDVNRRVLETNTRQKVYFQKRFLFDEENHNINPDKHLQSCRKFHFGISERDIYLRSSRSIRLIQLKHASKPPQPIVLIGNLSIKMNFF
ncbi:hypothetical protein EUGRSUZ_B03522 [Eucalyptus grandis]|uniref:Uncharacterized protein n=2 Tax=Eucalyptus grandis TaxID=71139 RepID=A0ACC3LXZ2_EUCGR|nr:hypothetical protein EUGRSUZ_B03522 [Eucalyptus grandis]